MAAEVDNPTSSPIVNIASKDEIDNNPFDENDIVKAPKIFFAKSLAESLFNGLLQKVRNKGIPPQKGFIHLNKVCGYGSSTITKEYHKEPTRKLHNVPNLLHSTRRLTKQAVQEVCEKERQQRLHHHEQNGIPRYRSFIDFLDEYRHLVREAEKRDMSEASKTRQTVQANWPIVLEEIRRRGIIKSLNEKVELQRQETIRDLWAVAFNKLSRKELSAMASVHDNKQVIHEELKNVVIKKKNETKFKMAAITTYFNDLKDQMISSFRRKTLALQIKQQLLSEVRFRLEQNEKLRNDDIRRQTISNFEQLHRELKKIANLDEIKAKFFRAASTRSDVKKDEDGGMDSKTCYSKTEASANNDSEDVNVEVTDASLQDDPIRERARVLTNIVQKETVAHAETLFALTRQEEES